MIYRKIFYSIGVVVAGISLFAVSHYNYLFFHGLTELFSIVIGLSIFVLAWNTRNLSPNSYLLFIGISYFFVAVMDSIHTLGYKGMSVFSLQGGANMPTQIWIAGRYLQGISLLIAPGLIGRKLKPVPIFIIYTLASAALLSAIFSGVFPDAFIEGAGLTHFKVVSEYIISLFLAAAIIYLWKKRDYFERSVLNMLIWSMAMTIASEMAFTLYNDVYGFLNALGHYFKIGSYYLIYAAIVKTNLKKPYESLAVEIDNRRRSEEALREQEEELSIIFENVPFIMMLLDVERRVRRVNSFAGAFSGLSTAGMIGMRGGEALRCVHALDVPEGCGFGPHCEQCIVHRTVISTFETGKGNAQLEARLLFFLHGEKKEITFLLSTAKLSVRKQPMVLVSIQDITEQKKLEGQLRQAQKMESIGQLAGGIAHDFNNILSAIIGYGHVTLMKMSTDDPQRLNVQCILDAADRAAHLTKDLLLFSRKQISDRRPVELNAIIRAVEKFLIRVIGEDVAFKTTLYEGSIPVLADVHQLEQVLMNLATNARDAMPKGGVLSVVTEQIMLDKAFVSYHGYGKPGAYALVSVSDTGEGMDEHTRKRIFEPFFTTKEVGKGTGLGMAVVYGIIKEHEGYINVYSEPGKGTTFRIYLPVIESGVTEEKKAVSADYLERGTETILLAEDDEALRKLTVSVLRDFGYEVIVAVDGEDAVKKYTENTDRIQLLLFDIIMPKKTGKEAYDDIKGIKPGVKVIFLSGYAPDMIRQKAMLEHIETVVYKPISPADLLKKVRKALNEAR